MGTIVPIMGSIDSGKLRSGLFGQTRSSLLALLYGHADQPFYLRQLIRAVGRGNGVVQRELQTLSDLGLVVRRKQGNQVLYQADSRSPIFPEIKSLITKTVGMHDALRSSLAALGSAVRIAFVYGSLARQQERAESDVDVMVIGAAKFSEVVSALSPAQKAIGREINPTVYSAPDFRSRLKTGNHFLQSVMKEKKVFIIGNEHELRDMAAE